MKKIKAGFWLVVLQRTMLAITWCIIPGFSTFGQDLLRLKDGTEFRVNIIEDGKDSVKYREYGNDLSPLYILSKEYIDVIKFESRRKAFTVGRRSTKKEEPSTTGENIAFINLNQTDTAKYLSFKNGDVYLGGNKLMRIEVRTLMEDNPGSLKTYNNSCKVHDLGRYFAVPALISLLGAEFLWLAHSHHAITSLEIGGALLVPASLVLHNGNRKLKKAINEYNLSAGKPGTCRIGAGIQNKSICFRVEF